MTQLRITYDELVSEIGRYIGAGRSGHTSVQTSDISEAIKRGLRSFYWPVMAERQEKEGISWWKSGETYLWSFLRKSAQLTLTGGQQSYHLPDDFFRLSDRFVFPAGSDALPLDRVSEDEIRRLTAKENLAGKPLYFAIRNVTASELDSGQKEVLFYPIPDSSAVSLGALEYRYGFEPQAIGEGNPSPLGGAAHAETILLACLDAADRVTNTESWPGSIHEQFQRQLHQSIEEDHKLLGDGATEATVSSDAIVGLAPGLGINKAYLRRLIGQKLEYSGNPSAWSHTQSAKIADILRSGLRKFYNPQVLPGESFQHSWKFLTPNHEITFVADQTAYDLPPDFSVLHGPIVYRPTSTTIYPSIKIVGSSRVEQELAGSFTATYPRLAATRVKSNDKLHGTRHEIIFAPIPSEASTVYLKYRINPDQLTDEQALPLGGEQHAQTLIESCLAACEVDSGRRGAHYQEFMECLRASISSDRDLHSPDHVGRGLGRGMDGEFGDGYIPYQDSLVTYTGYDID